MVWGLRRGADTSLCIFANPLNAFIDKNSKCREGEGQLPQKERSQLSTMDSSST